MVHAAFIGLALPLLVAPANQAAAVAVEPVKACYRSGESPTMLGSGFSPGQSVTITSDGAAIGGLATDNSGSFIGPLRLDLSNGEKTTRYGAIDKADPALMASTQLRVSALAVKVRPHRTRLGRRIEIRARGFTTGGRLYAHVRRGRGHRRTVMVGKLGTACRKLTKRRRIIPASAPGGRYRVQFDTRRKYSAETKVRVRFKVRVSTGGRQTWVLRSTPAPAPPGPTLPPPESPNGFIPITSCFPRPSACGYPDATNTGVPAGAVLTQSGSITVTAPGAIVENVDVNGSIAVAANNVTIRNTRVTASGGEGRWGVEIKNGVTGTLVQDTAIRGAGASGGQEIESGIRAINAGTTTVQRTYIDNCGHCIISESPLNISDSFISASASGGSYHFEPIYICGTSINANHNTFLNPHQQTAAVFGDTICGSNSFTVTNSLLAGGGFLVYPAANSSSVGGNTSDVSGNRFARCLGPPAYNASSGGTSCSSGADAHGYYPRGGYFGVAAYNYSGSGQIWSNNRWDDNGEIVCPSANSRCN